MEAGKMRNYVGEVLTNMPSDWLNLTTHRLDIYDESQAKSQFLNQFEHLCEKGDATNASLSNLPTAFDYIRLGHPLSCVLEWTVAQLNELSPNQVISFSSKTAPILAVLRKNLHAQIATRIVYTNALPGCFNEALIKRVYNYKFELLKVESLNDLPAFEGSTLFVSNDAEFAEVLAAKTVDFFVRIYDTLGSIIVINTASNASYISEIQHVRRRETIAMTPADCNTALQQIVNESNESKLSDVSKQKAILINCIKEITDSPIKPLVASSGLSMQYAIMMGLIDHALDNHAGKAIKIIVPPNCYGGTNDQARRVAANAANVDIIDLPVDGDNDMVQSIDQVLTQLAAEDAVPFIIAEIPTNPRVEVPDLDALQTALSQSRSTADGRAAIAPVFILDQTFCPNVHFLGKGATLAKVKTIAYVSGSKFPSGGKCTAGYCVGNELTEGIMAKIETHLQLCDNEATNLQIEILAQQMPSMNQRIQDAYANTRAFVKFIEEKLPTAKINFVSDELAALGFTPSVFSLDLPTKGNTAAEKESYKRALNHRLIKRMISEIPNESKYCVSYGQLKGCYWTIPATSTQGTTQEGDKDYIARVALSPKMDLDLHKKIFDDFVLSIHADA